MPPWELTIGILFFVGDYELFASIARFLLIKLVD